MCPKFFEIEESALPSLLPSYLPPLYFCDTIIKICHSLKHSYKCLNSASLQDIKTNVLQNCFFFFSVINCACMCIRGKGVIGNRYFVLYLYMYICIFVHTWLFYNPEHGCFACEVYMPWSVHLWLQACSKAVPTLQESPALLQPCDHLATTLKPARRRDKSMVYTTSWKGCHNLVPTMPQPCSNLTTTL